MNEQYSIRIPVDMIQLTDRNGETRPLAFDWKDEETGEIARIKIERVISHMPFAEQKSGIVGDRYECVIDGKEDYLFYTILKPRKWFKLKAVNEAEYKAYYKLPHELAATTETEINERE